jgi:hypothetical protein
MFITDKSTNSRKEIADHIYYSNNKIITNN